MEQTDDKANLFSELQQKSLLSAEYKRVLAKLGCKLNPLITIMLNRRNLTKTNWKVLSVAFI